MDKQTKLVTLTEDQRSALQAICRRRKVDALVWKRARAFLLLDASYDAKTICEILDIGPTVLTEWRLAFAGMGLTFFGLKNYSQRQGHLSLEQEWATQAHFTEHSARNADEVCAYILAEHGQSYSASGAAKLLGRLGFVYKKPQSLPAQADEAKQAAFIAKYEALMTGLGTDEMVVFSTSRTCNHVLPGKGCSASRAPKPSGPWLVPQEPKNRH
jgi:transposase